MAVKIMKIPDLDSEEKRLKIIQKLKKEIALSKNLKHKNVVNYLDSCIVNESEVNIYMEYLPGGSLQSLLKQHCEFEGFDEDIIRRFTK